MINQWKCAISSNSLYIHCMESQETTKKNIHNEPYQITTDKQQIGVTAANLLNIHDESNSKFQRNKIA